MLMSLDFTRYALAGMCPFNSVIEYVIICLHPAHSVLKILLPDPKPSRLALVRRV